jgi:hypothetical protein
METSVIGKNAPAMDRHRIRDIVVQIHARYILSIHGHAWT